MAGETTTVQDADYGIGTSLSGYTIESENCKDVLVLEKVPDQRNRTKKELLVESCQTVTESTL